MEPLSALAITTLAFISVKASETVIEKVTETTLAKANELREKIWHKLNGNLQAKEALQAAVNSSGKDLKDVANYLENAMANDQKFAQEILVLAQGIQEKLNDKNVRKQIDQSQTITHQTINVNNQKGDTYINSPISNY